MQFNFSELLVSVSVHLTETFEKVCHVHIGDGAEVDTGALHSASRVSYTY